MSTSWSETAVQICEAGLRHLGVLPIGSTISGRQLPSALRALDTVLKEMPLHGYSWPKLSTETALAWVSGQTISLPSDYYALPIIWKASSGAKPALTQLTHADWIANQGRSLATGEPTHFYVSPAKVVYLYPTPTADPALTIQYQRIVDDSSSLLPADMLQFWTGPLAYGVANELALTYTVAQDVRIEVDQRWAEKRLMAIESSESLAPISFSVQE